MRINIRGHSKDTGSGNGSISGHANVTLARSTKDKGVTYGATTVEGSPLLGQIYRWLDNDDDGVLLDETDALKNGKFTWVTRAVPVTESQLMAIERRLNGLEEKRYNYHAGRVSEHRHKPAQPLQKPFCE